MPTLKPHFTEPPGLRHLQLQTARGAFHLALHGAGQPVLLLHGWPEFWATWLPMLNTLSAEDLRQYQFIAPDLRGFGQSAKADGPSTNAGPDVHADDMAALLDALQISKACVVGHDVGAYVAQSMARRHAHKLERLLFFNCPTPGIGTRWVQDAQVNEIWYQSFHQLPLAEALVGHSRESCRLYFTHFLKHWSHRKDAFDDAIELFVDNFMQPGNLVGGFNWYRSQNAARLAAINGNKAQVAIITQPTKVLWGRHDPILKSAWADCLHEYFSDVTVGYAEHAGHFVHVECPDEAAQALRSFFSAH